MKKKNRGLLFSDYVLAKRLSKGKKGVNISDGALYIYSLRLMNFNLLIFSIIIYNLPFRLSLDTLTILGVLVSLFSFYGIKKYLLNKIAKGHYSRVLKKIPNKERRKYYWISGVSIPISFIIMFIIMNLTLGRMGYVG